MKKILFTLLSLLCCTAAAWAETGDGSPEKPYTGKWSIIELTQVIKIGDHLAYGCEIVTDYLDKGEIIVNDTKLNKLIVSERRSWDVGSPIGDRPSECYSAYCSWNSLNDRRKQTFIVTAITVNLETNTLSLSGYYSGMYLTTNSAGYLEVRTGAEFAAAIKANNSAKIKLEADIDVSNLGTICDTFSGQINGKYQFTREDGVLRDTIYSLDGKERTIAPLFNKLEHAVIEHVLLYNVYVIVDDSDDNVGALAKEAYSTTFNHAMMNKVGVSSKKNNVGGLLGYATKCEFNDITWANCSVTTPGVGAGGIVGRSSYCSYTHCTNNPRCAVYAEGSMANNHARSGGYIGYSIHDKFTNCGNTAIVGGNEDSVGGFTGRSDNSDFVSCVNTGAVVHCTEQSFNELVWAWRDALDDLLNDLTALQITLITSSFFGSAIAGGYTAYIVTTALGAALEGSGLADGLITGLICATGFTIFVVIIVAVIAAGVFGAFALTEHDEIGGISGQANGGQFSLCTNRGYINCRDSQGGGIVGRANGIVANNCLNTQECAWGDDDCGSIIGEALNGCKVTNCLDLKGYPIMGVAKDMNTASGNNYSMNAGDNSWEENVTEEQLKSGLVAYWLNNGVENRTSGVKPWHQNIGKDKDYYPTLDPLYGEVTIENLNLDPYEIGTPYELYYFATMVFFDKFAVGVLTADIDMTDQLWVMPIGAGEENSFRGIFDGQGHTISGLDFRTDADMGAALFGVVHHGAVIRNVTVKDSKFSHANDYGAAGIVGRISFSWWGNVVIENCASYADVHGKKYAGGILGCVSSEDVPNVNVYVDNCYNGGTITAEAGNSALLCGYVGRSGHIHNSWSDGLLRNGDNKGIWPYSIENPKNPKEAECLVGYATNLDIKNCYIVNPDDNVDKYKEDKGKYPLQAGVEIISDESTRSGEFAYKLNDGVIDGTQAWYQKLGEGGDSYPVLIKLTDGTNMVFRYKDADGNYQYGNTSREEISDVILGYETFDKNRVTDINQSGNVDVTDVITFVGAANK